MGCSSVVSMICPHMSPPLRRNCYFFQFFLTRQLSRPHFKLCVRSAPKDVEDTSESPIITEDVIYNVEDLHGYDTSLLLNMSDVWQDVGKVTSPKRHCLQQWGWVKLN